ncbi:ferric reductase-like transmembrane domain-containing protein [Bordetella pseudohinzii]|uniref:Benzoate 1,2-dioxygenase electron transfer component n=1 Tax=Bordetella pseudohinzii TaxID=1331258 RepID=A0A0J6C2N1_9BORD|nr:ferric reductase-like transmembrane domain-containing protein [Bordetella pseudohinzii]ANY16210.1 ferric reductase [Bordetella pseudohinzii]KMM25298.1 ferric reductase [Bordetella pseudohinzii]KXA78657.1 ferric reductase [Bordetella pseudohinzii]KXA81190.1 ferric reductase [Bordetella pseudohinzii]CUJ05252.1 Benzoate 1%2C2-dioxygenase electron transfer component [Bordetella pseudohinzii]
MNRIRWAFVWGFVVVVALWLAAHAEILFLRELFQLRHQFILLTGLLAFAAMAVGTMLSVRPASIEPPLGGLDKMYRLHKWLGLTALCAGVLHWLWIKAPKWAVDWGWIVRPPRGERPTLQGLEAVFRQQRGLAETLGEYAFYALIILVCIALFSRIPYRYFRLTHRLMAVVALLFCWHALVLTEYADWRQPVGWLTALLIAGCAVGALIGLCGQIGRRRQVPARITALEPFRDNRVLKVVLGLQKPWPGHQAGQFAFVTFDPREGAHPFTISSAWSGGDSMYFLIKGVGDYTSRLPELLRVGGKARVEGPYGSFQFGGPQQRQIWIGAGIGITPFIARMQTLAIEPDKRRIDLFYVTQLPDQVFVERLQGRARLAGVNLHIHINHRDPRLTGEVVREQLPDWQSASIWFCGPAGMGDELLADMQKHGLDPAAFHREFFQMR